MDRTPQKPVVIIGAGPAGLTAGYELARRKIPFLILEKDHMVGGIARTVEYHGYRFDIGGHRFFTKVDRVMEMWQEVLKDDFLKRPRMSHVYYKKKFFAYPIKPFDVVQKLGLWESFLAGLSFIKAKVWRRAKEESFEDYIVNNFGERLYHTFFKSYTEKVWGIPCTEIKAEWAAQRIKGLSLSSLIKTAFLGNRGNDIKSLIEEFWYPRLGPGMMWERTVEIIEKSGFGKIVYNVTLDDIEWGAGRIKAVRYHDGAGVEQHVDCDALVSSMPIPELAERLLPPAEHALLEAAKGLHFRDFLTVALVIKQKEMFPDNWIYIHEPKVQVGRIQNFKNWSPEMVKDEGMTCLGLEYFCFTSDPLWRMSDKELIALASKELEVIGLAQSADVVDGAVVRMEKTYPVYDDSYEKAMPTIRHELARFTNLYPVGRNGMHKYNNQDHAMLTAMLAVENYADYATHDLWQVNVERVYHEEDKKNIS